LQGGPPRRDRSALPQTGEWPMTSVRHDDHRCRLRVLSSRHGRPMPIARSNGPADPTIALLAPSFASPNGTRPQPGPSRRLSPAVDPPIRTPAAA
jgi:hypothetical protein